MPSEFASDRAADTSTAEQRWDASVTRGIEDERQSRKRGYIGLAMLAAVVTLGLLLLR